MVILLVTAKIYPQTNLITFTNKGGEVISNAPIISTSAVDLFYEIPGGGARVHLADLPLEVSARFGYNPLKAKASTNILFNTKANATRSSQRIAIEEFLAKNENSTLESAIHVSDRRDARVGETIWGICVKASGFTFTSTWRETEYSNQFFTDKMDFKLSEEAIARKIFDKFLEWDSVARSHDTEAFTKIIPEWPDSTLKSAGRCFTFEWAAFPSVGERRSSLVDSMSGRKFNKETIIHFRSLIEHLPDLKAELADSIRRSEAQKNLFK
jgi:hypothetical protein